MAGRALRGMLRTADYKGGKALKSCHTEFYHIHSAAFFRYKGGFLLKESSFFYAVRPIFLILIVSLPLICSI